MLFGEAEVSGWPMLPWRRQSVTTAPPPPPPAERSSTVAEAPKPPPAPAGKPAASKIVLVTVLGMRGEALANVVETVTAECKQARTRPLFITDQNNFATFRASRSLFEQVIDVERCRAQRPDLDWQMYGEHQYRLIGRKWKPVTTIAFGRKPNQVFLDAVLRGVREKL
jgi:hypothetical protein